ncbi:MAG: DNRLRE domain-containing protein, partial [Anaerolineaceae bacterium]|nr:DNRLRE domain-containing protein [Anaerolineaceae bacterium]
MSKSRIAFIFFTGLAVMGLFSAMLPGRSAIGQSTTITIKPAADAYVTQSNAKTNYGSNSSIRIDNSPITRSYLRFEVGGLNGATVQSAKLRVYANSEGSAGYTASAVSDNDWSENKISFSNAPSLGGEIGKAGDFNGGQWTEVDVSGYIKGEGVISLALATSSKTSVNLASRESSNPPQLVLTLAGAAPTSAPTQPQTTVIPIQPTKAPTVVPTQPGVTSTAAPTNPPSGDPQPSFPIRAGFYYPWFPQAWTQLGIYPYTNYNPTLGFYNGADLATVKKHIDMLQYGGMQAGIASWWGQGSQTDSKVPVLLQAAAGTPFRWALYYENESLGDPSAAQISTDLTFIRDHYGKDPSFLRVNGKFVVFVYAAGNDACGMADRWKQGNTVGAYVVLKVFPGYANCASQPDSWHQYSPAVAADSQGSLSYTISPGFWLKGNAMRLGRDLNRWISNVKSLVASGAKWQLVTTFNEWGEGTSVEPAKEWSSASGYGQYLDALHTNGGAAPAPTQPPANPTPTQPPANPTATPLPTGQPTPQPTAQPTDQPAPTQPPSNGSDPIIFFQGDLVSGSSMSRAQLVVAQIKKLMAQHAGTKMLVASTGDNEQENNPTQSNYQQYFGNTFGAFVTQGIFMQIRGNHDIQSAGSYTDYNGATHASGAAYWDYFGANARAANISGQKLTDYSYDLGNWHIVGLDQLNGSVNNATLNFLKADLAAHAGTKCQLVYWHVPTYSSGAAHGDSTGLKPINQAEYDAGVDIQINGHDHDYQRFYPLNPNGQRDDVKGITTFIDGIGGQDGRSGSQMSVAQAASAVYLDAFPSGEAIGTIMFTLHANSADYALYNANTGAVVDQGTV